MKKSSRIRKSSDSLNSGIPNKPLGESKTGLNDHSGSFPMIDTRTVLRPEGAADLDERVFDVIVFFIYCPKHDNIAVQTYSGSCTWLPFIIMPRNTPWRKATIDGVMMLIGRQDAELDGVEAEKVTPEFKISCLHHFRVQVYTKHLYTRLTQFIHLINNGVFECCKNSESITWLPSDKIIRRQLPNVWGPELKILSSMLLLLRPSIIAEFTLQNATYYYTLKDSNEEKLLKSLNFTEQNVIEIYTDYLEYCYPSFYMCFQSYKNYMESMGFTEKEKRYEQMFAATAVFHKWYLDFHEFLIGVSILEPEVSNTSPLRESFIFNFYDEGLKGYLSRSDIEQIVRDAGRGTTQKVVQVYVNKIAKKVPDINRVGPKEFGNLLKDSSLESSWNSICRSPKSIVKQIIELVKKRKTDSERSMKTEHALRSSRPPNENGTCNGCRAANYNYGNHSITIDTLGRCVESTIVSHMWQKPEAASHPNPKKKCKNKKMDPFRYSLEITFSNSSIPNLFFDLVRNSFNSKDHKMWTETEESWPTFHKYLTNLCSGVKDIFHAEQKMIRINSPCLVFGDIQGNLNDLLFLEKACFTSFPVIPEKLLFLGNYSGNYSNSFEIIVYLFSMKIMSPTKVFLLRGVNEMSIPCAKHLFYQCVNKYGKDNGKVIFSKFMDVFKTMPVSAIIDENIFCSHSGIPTKQKIDTISNLAKDLVQIQEKHPLVNELMTRHPHGTPFYSAHSLKSSSTRARHLESNVPSRFSRIRSSGLAKSCTSSKVIKKSSTESSMKSRETSLKRKLSRISSGKIKKVMSNTRSHMFISIKKKQVKAYLKRAKRKSVPKPANLQSGSETYTQIFDEEEFRTFLERNDVTFMVRANTQTPYGFWLKFNNRCITVYSCSTPDTQGSILFVDKSNSSIRIIRFAASCKSVNTVKLFEN